MSNIIIERMKSSPIELTHIWNQALMSDSFRAWCKSHAFDTLDEDLYIKGSKKLVDIIHRNKSYIKLDEGISLDDFDSLFDDDDDDDKSKATPTATPASSSTSSSSSTSTADSEWDSEVITDDNVKAATHARMGSQYGKHHIDVPEYAPNVVILNSNYLNKLDHFYTLDCRDHVNKSEVLPISFLNTSSMTTLAGAFAFLDYPNVNLANWDTANVTNMEATFFKSSFNNPSILDWDLTKVTYSLNTFTGCPFSYTEINTSENKTQFLLNSDAISNSTAAQLAIRDAENATAIWRANYKK